MKNYLFVFRLQGGYVYITIKCENAGLPIGLQILNVHLGTAPLAGLIILFNFFFSVLFNFVLSEIISSED